MKIYVFRHAQKAMDFSGDPDLTVEGHAQASKLVDKVLKSELPTPTEIWSSPKKRSLSTLRPLAEHLNIPLHADDVLLEQKSDETLQDFRKRISQLFDTLSDTKDRVIFLCSHYDWVVEAMALVNCNDDLTSADFSHWTPCQHVGFELQPDGFYKFLELKRVNV